MILKIFAITIGIVALVVLALGIKILFDTSVNIPSVSCKASSPSTGGFSCGCSEDTCKERIDEQYNKS